MSLPLCRAVLLGIVLVTLTGCGTSTGSAPAPTPTLVSTTREGLQAVVASSDLAVGMNRFTFGLIDNNHPMDSGSATIKFYALHGNTGTLKTTTVGRFNNFARGLKHTAENQAAINLKGVYVTNVVLPSAGNWGAVFTLHRGGKVQTTRTQFTVRKHSLSPSVGSPAPRSNNPTTAQEPATKLDSGRPPDDMHKLSIAHAIAQHKPLIVLFATAAYCTSRLCGPEIEIMQGLERQYRGRVNFVHIEIYRNANPVNGYAPAVTQWHLVTEPWVFVVDRRGIIVAKFEGPTPSSEIVPAIRRALRSTIS